MGKFVNVILASATVCAAFGIGHLMQATPVAEQRYASPQQGDQAAQTTASPFSGMTDLELTGITYTSASDAAPAVTIAPAPRSAPSLLILSDNRDVRSAPALDRTAAIMNQTDGTQTTAPRCNASLTAKPLAAAMVQLTLDAPCAPDQRVTLHHNGMMITERTDENGQLFLAMPALLENATFMAAFDDGVTAMALAQITSIEIYDRVVVQWQGPGQIQLHALEFGADYGDEGHVWSSAPQDTARGALGKGGFLTVYGQPMTDLDLRAQVYTFPSGTTSEVGDIDLSIEAAITPETCDRIIEAQTLQMSGGQDLKVTDVTLSMPDCDGTDGFLVLKNLLQDMKIAHN